MEYYHDILCASVRDLSAVMSLSNYKQLAARGKIEVIRRACRGRQALVVFDTLPERYKAALKETCPEGGTMQLRKWFREHYALDAEARTFYSRFRFDNGDPLPADKQIEYTVNASVIRAVLHLMADTQALRRAQAGGRVNWEEMAAAVAYFRQEYGHTLPESTLRLRRKVADFHRAGYAVLISGKFRNQNSRKVNYRTERLILSLDSLPERPFNTTVAELYNQFVCGELDVYDPETGELFDPAEFTDRKGEPVALSETTVANYLNNPRNRALRARLHDTAWDFNNRYRPHHKRKAPVWAFSKISLDDRDLPRRMADGSRVKAYYAYDVASGCVVGYAHNRLKTADLFLDCVRSMFRLIDRQGWNCPAEVEVEHHLVNNFADGLIRAGVVFPFVRWCNPGNSQEKRAEHFNRAKKYGVEKRMQAGIGRWYARLEANRPRVEKVYDARNDTYREAAFTYEQLVADDIRAIREYNARPHPNRKLYPGLTRWEVLCRNQNPGLSPVDKALLYRFIGERTRTSIRRSKYCRVRYEDYALPSPELLARLAPGDYGVEAYYLPDDEGCVSEVYLYQGEVFIARCARIEAYNEAAAEQTDEDRRRYAEQAQYNARFDALMRRERIRKVRILPRGLSSGEADPVYAAAPSSRNRDMHCEGALPNGTDPILGAGASALRTDKMPVGVVSSDSGVTDPAFAAGASALRADKMPVGVVSFDSGVTDPAFAAGVSALRAEASGADGRGCETAFPNLPGSDPVYEAGVSALRADKMPVGVASPDSGVTDPVYAADSSALRAEVSGADGSGCETAFPNLPGTDPVYEAGVSALRADKMPVGVASPDSGVTDPAFAAETSALRAEASGADGSGCETAFPNLRGSDPAYAAAPSSRNRDMPFAAARPPAEEELFFGEDYAARARYEL